LPFSVGLWRPTLVLPARLARQASEEELRWVLAHELTHLERHDTRTCWLFALAQAVYFYLPWLWWLRREVRLCQEYIADAAAARAAGCRTDYAQFLLDWAGRPPAGATGVSGSHSDLFRRIAMLLKSSAELDPRCPRRWVAVVGCGLLSLGVLAGGLGLRARADEKKPEEPKKPETKQPEKKPRPAPGTPGFVAPNLDKLFEQLGAGLDGDAEKELRKQMDELRKQIDEMRKRLGRPGAPGFPGLQNPPNFPNLPGGFPGGGLIPVPHQARLGAQVSRPTQTLVDQLDLPREQGLVLDEVGANSAAAKAGLKRHDILLEIDGKAVPSNPQDFVKMLDGVKPNTPIDAVVLRKGKKETVRGLQLPEKKAAVAPALPNFPGLPGGRLVPNLNLPFGLGNMTGITRNGDEFTATQQSDGVRIVVKGKVDQGKATVREVEVDANGQKNRYDSLDKVPAEYREKAQKLADAAAGKGVRFTPAPRPKAKDVL
jgi:hypothetical protein